MSENTTVRFILSSAASDLLSHIVDLLVDEGLECMDAEYCSVTDDPDQWNIALPEGLVLEILDECHRLQNELEDAIAVIEQYSPFALTDSDDEANCAVKAYAELYGKLKAFA